MLLQVLKLCSGSLKCSLVLLRFSFVLSQDAVWPVTAATLGYSKDFQLHHKYFCERCNAGTNLGNDLHFSFQQHAVLKSNDLIFLPRNLKPARLHPRYSLINELLGCIVLLVFPLCKFTSGPVIPLRAEYLFCLSVLQLPLLQGCLAIVRMSLTEIKIIE